MTPIQPTSASAQPVATEELATLIASTIRVELDRHLGFACAFSAKPSADKPKLVPFVWHRHTAPSSGSRGGGGTRAPRAGKKKKSATVLYFCANRQQKIDVAARRGCQAYAVAFRLAQFVSF